MYLIFKNKNNNFILPKTTTTKRIKFQENSQYKIIKNKQLHNRKLLHYNNYTIDMVKIILVFKE